MCRLRSIYPYLLVSILTFAIGLGLAIHTDALGWPYPIHITELPEPNAQWYENTFDRKEFSGDIEAIYTGTVGDPYASGMGCFEVTNHTDESVYYWGYGINAQGAVVKQDGRIWEVTSTPEPDLLELKVGEDHDFCVTVPPNHYSFTVDLPVQVGPHRTNGTVSVTVAVPVAVHH